jgi:lipid-binding SYLF domain-containing protein
MSISRFLPLVLALGACSTAPSSDAEKDALHSEVQATIDSFRFKSPVLQRFFDNAHGYAVFPSIGKGGLIVGGAHGRGELYKGKELVGHCDMTQASVGLQIGGQAYRQVIFFQNEATFERFKSGNFSFAANASAVAVEAGVSTTVDYENGVAVFTMARAGVMGEAAIGGQKFSFVPLR